MFTEHDEPVQPRCISIRKPSAIFLPGFLDALKRGWPEAWEPSARLSIRVAAAEDPTLFLDRMVRGEFGTVSATDASDDARVSGRTFWIWDGEFCGAIEFRYVPRTEDLPAGLQGHVGFAVVPWKCGQGYATRALAMLVPVLEAETTLDRVSIVCEAGNIASRRVVEKIGGRPDTAPEGETVRFWLPIPRSRSSRISMRPAERAA
jgi:predicted acetyltransferase